MWKNVFSVCLDNVAAPNVVITLVSADNFCGQVHGKSFKKICRLIHQIRLIRQ